MALYRSVKYIREGLTALWHGKLTVAVLTNLQGAGPDELAQGVEIDRRDGAGSKVVSWRWGKRSSETSC